MTLADPPTPTRSAHALLVANLRYWPTVSPLVGRELRRWASRAEAIPDRDLKALACAKLADEHFNAQVAATLATLAPLAHRATVTRAIVAHQVLYDYLDGLTEQRVPEHLQSNLRLYRALTDSVTAGPGGIACDYFSLHPTAGDGGYLQALVRAVADRLARLPAAAAIHPVAAAVAHRCGEAQSMVHVTGSGEPTSLAAWADGRAHGTPLGWREWLAGAVSCVLCDHALIAAAADDATTPQDAVALDDAYMPIAALSTMLDGLVDWSSDRSNGQTPWLLSHYERPADLLQSLAETAARAATCAARLPHAAHHVMSMSGVVAYYASSPAAREPHARPVADHLRRELGPTFAQVIAVMRAWRACKRIRRPPLLLTRSEVPPA